MSRRQNPPMPNAAFGLLLVEGGDERALCEAVAGPSIWSGLCCWVANGRRKEFADLAALAVLDPGFVHARSIGVVLDIEEDLKEASNIAEEVLKAFGGALPPVHGVVAGQPRPMGAFLAPDGQSPGSIEVLCRPAVREPTLAKCVDALEECAQAPHPTRALAAKGWLHAYFAMCAEPHRFHEAFHPTRGSIDPTHGAFDPLRNFLKSL